MIERVERKGTNSEKYNPKHLLNLCGNANAEPFWVADMDFESPKPVQQALLKVASQRTYGYPGFEELPQAFCDFAKRRHNLDLCAEDAIVSPGILTSISIVTQMYPDYEVIIPKPAYRPFVAIAENHNRKIHHWALSYDRENARFGLDLAELERIAALPGKKMLSFCSPHNPSGRVWTREELLGVIAICKRHDMPILCDEIHADLAYRSSVEIPFLTLARECGINAICFMAPSKTFNIAGEHMSVTLFTNPALRDEFARRLHQIHFEGPSLFSGTAALAAYQGGYDWLMELVDMLESNAKFVCSYMKAEIPQMRFVMPQASFITFVDCRDIRERLPQGMDVSHFFGTKADVAMNYGLWFGDAYEDFVRFNFGTDRSHIEAALERMAKAVRQL